MRLQTHVQSLSLSFSASFSLSLFLSDLRSYNTLLELYLRDDSEGAAPAASGLVIGQNLKRKERLNKAYALLTDPKVDSILLLLFDGAGASAIWTFPPHTIGEGGGVDIATRRSNWGQFAICGSPLSFRP
jgi:hypothetical protein